MIQTTLPAATPTPRTPAPGPRETALMVSFQEERTSAAFEELYRAAAPALLEWITRHGATRRYPVDPRDALQDTFVNIYRYAGSFDGEASGGFRAWARTIAGNVMRRARTRPRSAGVLFADMGGAAPEGLEAGKGTPATAAESAETTGRLDRAYLVLLACYADALGQLRERDRRALHWVEVEGLSYAEVGRRLGTGRSNTKMVVFRARARLMRHIQERLARCAGEASAQAA